jgi:hypothetical protein
MKSILYIMAARGDESQQQDQLPMLYHFTYELAMMMKMVFLSSDRRYSDDEAIRYACIESCITHFRNIFEFLGDETIISELFSDKNSVWKDKWAETKKDVVISRNFAHVYVAHLSDARWKKERKAARVDLHMFYKNVFTLRDHVYHMVQMLPKRHKKEFQKYDLEWRAKFGIELDGNLKEKFSPPEEGVKVLASPTQ